MVSNLFFFHWWNKHKVLRWAQRCLPFTTSSVIWCNTVYISVSVHTHANLGPVKMRVRVSRPVLSPPVPVTTLLSSISLFKQDKAPVHITALSPPRSAACHSPSFMKAGSFCLKVGDERGAAVRDLVGLTDRIRATNPGERGRRWEQEVRGCFCLTGLEEGAKGRYMGGKGPCLSVLGEVRLQQGGHGDSYANPY